MASLTATDDSVTCAVLARMRTPAAAGDATVVAPGTLSAPATRSRWTPSVSEPVESRTAAVAAGAPAPARLPFARLRAGPPALLSRPAAMVRVPNPSPWRAGPPAPATSTPRTSFPVASSTPPAAVEKAMVGAVGARAISSVPSTTRSAPWPTRRSPSSRTSGP